MPAQPAWFHRLDEILSAPRAMTSTRVEDVYGAPSPRPSPTPLPQRTAQLPCVSV